ncbi:S8 family serine peptidase [Phytohabitans sp. ZYX-F-186]|uniref:S8 family serine peptidase n=1 Tax=Phytohabitans maris TaxID=3071409 RepID=A0ABU0ZFA0_9ACTN|nr:S8 family serine peptidase [Phytohabitans sp. ZYX-F-186]MDQ7905727.1 S8 family serine peptidase [Phytohabitans sp. ZYX-F-186]
MDSPIRTLGRWGLAAALGLLAALAPAPARADDSAYVKFYTVNTAYQGAPESLAGIAERFLGATDRADEVFHLNLGRPQPDGGTLTDPARLRPGWRLVLPWDAVGAGVQYGTLAPAPPPAAPTSPPKGTPAPPAASGKPAPGGAAVPGGAAAPQQGVRPTTAPRPPAAKGCAPPKATRAAGPDWATRRLAADRAWSRGRGKGQLIAVVDSGVDGSLPQLAGHVTVGVDVVTAGGRGDVDCLGTGTAMAGILVGQGGKGGGPAGVAPDATVLPVRLVTGAPTARPADQAAAIGQATAAGATVIALGSYVDTNETAVAEAIAAATANDVVVVAGAAPDGTPVNAAAVLPAGGVLRVGAVGANGQPAVRYRPGGVDVVAPGVDVTSLGVAGAGGFVGSGTQYAVAYAAGQAALVRSAFPDLAANQVVHRVKATARKPTDTAAGAGWGHGMIDPFASVHTELPDERPARGTGPAPRGVTAPDPVGGPGGGRVVALVAMALVMLTALVLLVFRLRLVLRARAAPVADPYREPDAPATTWPTLSDLPKSD